MKNLSFAAVAAFSLLTSAASATRLDALVANGGTLSVGGLVFSGFHISQPPISFGVAAGGGGDVDVTAVLDADGNPGLRFTGVDAKGKPTPWDSDNVKEIVRYAVFTVTSTDPIRLLSTAHILMGPGSFTTASGHVFFAADAFAYNVEEPANAWSILSYAQLGGGSGTRSNPQTSPLFRGDAPSALVSAYWDTQKGHGGKVTGARAVIDYVEMVFPMPPLPAKP